MQPEEWVWAKSLLRTGASYSLQSSADDGMEYLLLLGSNFKRAETQEYLRATAMSAHSRRLSAQSTTTWIWRPVYKQAKPRLRPLFPTSSASERRRQIIIFSLHTPCTKYSNCSCEPTLHMQVNVSSMKQVSHFTDCANGAQQVLPASRNFDIYSTWGTIPNTLHVDTSSNGQRWSHSGTMTPTPHCQEELRHIKLPWYVVVGSALWIDPPLLLKSTFLMTSQPQQTQAMQISSWCFFAVIDSRRETWRNHQKVFLSFYSKGLDEA